MLKALFEVAVKSTGLGKAKGDLDAMGKSAQNVQKSHNAARDAAEAHYAVQAKGVIGTANSTKSFSKLASTMGEGGGIVGAYATLAANVFAVTAAFNALKGAAQMEQITRGLEVLGARSGQSLGLVAKQLKDVTNGALNTEQSLRSTAQITSAGFDSGSVVRIGKLASDVSLALGRDMTDSMDRLTRGVIKLEPELLDELGLMTRLGEASAAYASELGKPVSALTTLEKRQGFMNAVMAEGELKFGGVSDAAGNLKNYDKLAATFADLTKNILNTVNALGGLDIAGFFAGNMTALAGAAVLFLSTLKSQLLPGMLSLTNKAAEAAKTAKETALKEQKDILQFNQNPAYLNTIKNKGDAANVNDYSQAVDRNKNVIDSLNKSVIRYSDSVTGNAARLDQARSSLKRHMEIQIELKEALVATHTATQQQTAADAVAAASAGKYGTAVNFLKASILSYAQAQMAALPVTNAWTRTLVAGKTAAYAFALSIKMIGVALLSAIPVIGQIIFVVGLLAQAYDKWGKSDSQKAREAGLKAVLELTATTSEKEKALTKIRESNASLAVRTEQRIILQSNALSELASKYAEVAKAAEDAAKAQNRAATTPVVPSKVAGIADIYGGVAAQQGDRIAGFFEAGQSEGGQARTARMNDRLNRIRNAEQSRRTGVAQDSRTLSEIGQTQILDPAAVATLDSMRRIAPEVTDEVIKLYGGLKDLSAIELKERNALIIAETGRRAAGGAELIGNLTSALKEMDAAYAAFYSAASAKTPFDGIVVSSRKVYNSINDLELAVANGIATVTDWQNVLTSLGDDNLAIISQENVESLNNYRTAVADIQRLENTAAEDRKEDHVARLDAARIIEAENRGILSIIQQALLEEAKITAEYQKRDVAIQSQIALLSAKLKIAAADNALTAEGVAAQINGENELKRLEISRIQVQSDLINRQINLKKDMIKASIDLLAVEQLLTAESRQQYKEAILRDITENTNRRREAIRTKQGTTLIDEALARQNAEKARLEAIENSIVSIESLEISRLGLMSQQAAIGETIVGDAERDALAAQQRLKTAIEQYQITEAIRAAEFQIALTAAKIANIRNGTSGTLAEQLSILRATTAEQLRAKAETDKAALAEIQAARLVSLSRSNSLEETDAAEALFNRRMELFTQRQASDSLAIAQAQELKELEIVSFNTRKEGLEWQKQSLEMVQKELEISNSLVTSAHEISQINAETARRRAGIRTSEDSTAADSLRVKTEEHLLLVQGLNAKKDIIRLEFALLDAQRMMMIQELQTRRNSGRLDAQQLAQLDSTLRALGSINSGAALAARLSAEDRLVAISSASLRRDSYREGTNSSAIANSRARRERRIAEEEARTAAATAIPSSTTSVAINNNAPRAVVEPALEASRTNTEALQELTAAIRAVSSYQVQSSSVRRTASEEAASLGTDLTARGFRVGGHSEFGNQGGPGAHMAGSYHYSDRALDINFDGPEEKAKLDTLAAELRAKYGDLVDIVWQTEGHFGHLHIEFDQAMYEARSNILVSAENTLNAVVDALPDESQIAPFAQAIDRQIQEAIAFIRQARNRPPTVENISAPGPVAALTPLKTMEEKLAELDRAARERAINTAEDMVIDLNEFAQPLLDMFEKLGPEGAIVSAAVAGLNAVASAAINAARVFNDPESNKYDKFVALAQIASAAIAGIQGAYAAASAAKIAGIDAEIAAEQKRDGKSADSVAKIAALEKKKDAAARKSFEINKKLMMAQAIISTAAGIAASLSYGGLPGIIMAGIVGAMGAAQLAIIAGTSYQGGSAASTAVATPSTLSIGKRGDSVDLARNNANAGGEIGYLRGARGRGSNASNYSVIGSAVGGALPRGYGNTAFVVGEHGPETITPETPITVRPMNDNSESQRALPPVNINIQALDAKGVEEILYGQRGNIIGMLREAANNSGQTFLESVNTAVYNKPNVGRL